MAARRRGIQVAGRLSGVLPRSSAAGGWQPNLARRHPEYALPLAGAAFALVLAYFLVHRSAGSAVALLLLPPAAWLATRSYGGLALGVSIIFVLPAWWTIGSAQVSVMRLAAVFALASFVLSRRFRFRLTDWALIVYVAVVVLGWLFQYDQPHAGRVVSLELTPVAFYLGARAIPRQRVLLVMLVTLFAGAIGALTVLYEVALGHVVFVPSASYGEWGGGLTFTFRPGGIFGTPPIASTMLSFAILYGAGALTAISGRLKLAAIGAIAICSVALVFTYTRAGIIGCAVGLLVFIWLWRPQLMRPLRVIWALVIAGALVLVLLPTLESSKTFQQGIVRPGTFASRETFWRDALPVVTSSTHNLFLGVGTATLEAPTLGNNLAIPADVSSAPVLTEISLQNQYITTLVEQGLLGVAALLFFLLSACLPVGRRAYKAGNALSAAVAASIVSLIVIMIADSALVVGPLFAMLLVSAGLGADALSSPEQLRASP